MFEKMLRVGPAGLASLCVLILTACGDDSSPAAPEDPDIDNDGFANEIDACPGSPETINNVFDTDGCPDVPLDLYTAVRSDTEQFWIAQFAAWAVPYRAVSGFIGYAAPIPTTCGTLQLNNAFYCPVEERIYYHTQLLDSFLSDVGDAAPATIIAHEFGHHVSYLLGWWALREEGFITKKQLELQADCFAGAWLQSADFRGLLDEGDVEEAVIAMFAFGDPAWAWFNPEGHGTAEQRASALVTGLIGGANACDATNFPAAAKAPDN